MNSTKMSDLTKQYRKHTHREHILALPDTYIGSIENAQEEMYVVDGEKFSLKTLKQFNPGFYKLIDELLVNAHDHVIRLRQHKSESLVKKIDISVVDNKVFVIRNDGESIDVDKHPDYGIYIPQMIFGELLTSTNYDTTEKKLVGGKNGYGVKLVNIFAKQLKLTIVDEKRGLKYVQVFEDNMSKIGKPSVTKCKTKSFVEVEWTPDFARFGWKDDSIPADVLALVERRVYDLAMTVGNGVRIMWCDTPIKFRSLESYAVRYLPEAAPLAAYSTEGLQLAVADSPLDRMLGVAFVNGIWTRTGKHIDEITAQIVSHVLMFLETKKKLKVKPSLIKDSLAIFMDCSIENPAFSSQTKDHLTSKLSIKLPDDFLKKIVTKLGLVEKVMAQQNVKDNKENTKTDGKKQSKIVGIPKLDDAAYAGTMKSQECTLILTEGDSAKAMALSGLSQEQRKYFGVFPLRGKLLNVKDTSVRKVEQTEEIANLKKIMGLESGKEYTSIKDLRYGRVLIMTDQDYDGAHIRGLLINLFHELWHTLFAIPGFLAYMATPIVKATKGKIIMSFYTQFEYEEWKEKAGPGWKVKYYKGLGTSTRDEAKEYFHKLNIMPYSYSGKDSDASIDLAFNKAKADDRKDWLKTYAKENVIGPTPALPYEDFVNKDLIHFSNYNLERSIPNVMDGLKTSQRKILFSAFKRNLKSEIRVAQFAGYVSEHSGYHHGEASLNDTIVGMAQDFVGSNNIPWFVPQGQFGTRLQGGNDAASPRYIHTYLQPYISKLVPDSDFECLKYRDDDGLPVEPEWYAPILPMLLINGSRGIGTGYSTFIPPYNPADLKRMLLKWLENGEGLDDMLVPWVKGFTGSIRSEKDKEFILEGKIEKDTIVELPVGTWTADVRETLETLLKDGGLKDYTDMSTDQQVCIKVKTADLKVLDKVMKDKWKLTNMHAFNSKCVIHKYESPNEILKEYASVRLNLFADRRAQILKSLKDTLPYHENVVRFIRQQSQDKPVPDLRRKTREDCDSMLLKEKFDKIKDGYDYLMNLPIASLTLTNAKKHEDELVKLRAKIGEMEATTPKQLWKSELTNLAF